MKKIVVLLLLILSKNVIANEPTYFCGYYYDSDYFYYNLFDQENISQKAFFPFLRTGNSPFYKDVPLKHTQNIDLWYSFFDKKYTKEDLVSVLYGKENTLSLIKKTTSKETAAYQYIQFAKDCEKVSAPEVNEYYWDYKKLRNKRKLNAPALLEKGLLLFSKEKNTDIKLRYAYQIISLYRYNNQFNKAIDFFNNEALFLNNKNEIYYYTLDQIAGCYYKLKNYEKSAYLFLKVFNKSIDKKLSAYKSYKFCTNKKAEGTTYFTTKEDQAIQIFITAIRKFSDTMQDLRKITELGIAEDKQELLVIRMINNFEREMFSANLKKDLFQKNKSTNYRIKELQRFVSLKIDANTTNIEFWKLADTYLTFLSEDIEKAQKKLKNLSDDKYGNQKEKLNILFNVFSWDSIDTNKEKWLGKTIIKDIKTKTGFSYYEKPENIDLFLQNNLKGIIGKQLSHLYLKENKLAKSYLLHNSFDELHYISSHKLADNLLTFINKKEKNNFEKVLLKEAEKKRFKFNNIAENVNSAKGKMFFRSGNFKKAIAYFNPNENKNIPASIFSNNTAECFECNGLKLMEDEVYKATVFSFLNRDMNTYDLLENLGFLEQMTKDESIKLWKRKLANYLLGNYFFNVSNTGYYRTITYPLFDSCNNYYFGNIRPEIKDVIDQKTTYSFPNYGYKNTYNSLADKSKKYYKQTITLSTDDELNARCSYMIAKCELNNYYNNTWKYEYGGYKGDDFKNHETEGFNALKTKYKSTNFKNLIWKKCSFFRYYDEN